MSAHASGQAKVAIGVGHLLPSLGTGAIRQITRRTHVPPLPICPFPDESPFLIDVETATNRVTFIFISGEWSNFAIAQLEIASVDERTGVIEVHGLGDASARSELGFLGIKLAQ